MLKRFEVKNYRGFKDAFVFDLEGVHDYNFNSELVKNGLVSKGIIYGKNGSGKSNLGFALMDIAIHLTDHLIPAKFNIGSYLNLNSNEKYATFKYFFQFDKDEVIYEYQKLNGVSLVNEKVSVNNEVILFIDYEHLNKENIILKVPGAENLIVDIQDNRLSLLKYVYRNTLTNEDSPITKVVKFSEGMLWFRSLQGNEFAGLKDRPEILEDLIIKENKVKELELFLKENELDYELKVKTMNTGEQRIVAKFKNGYILLSSIVSSGTASLILYFSWSLSFKKVSFLFIDEFDAFYHYEVSANILKLISKQSDLQAFVTSHNTYLMSNSITRPDTCFIICNNEIKSLINCTEKEIREAHNLEKMYRNGAFSE